mmetsp:Transcript_79352/g.257007  ORF Transcript_79352/g.257007 Transcript_79352/m.257007 type:complete len:568 (+) Transcript_79352:309-2012(+)
MKCCHREAASGCCSWGLPRRMARASVQCSAVAVRDPANSSPRGWEAPGHGRPVGPVPRAADAGEEVRRPVPRPQLGPEPLDRPAIQDGVRDVVKQHHEGETHADCNSASRHEKDSLRQHELVQLASLADAASGPHHAQREGAESADERNACELEDPRGAVEHPFGLRVAVDDVQGCDRSPAEGPGVERDLYLRVRVLGLEELLVDLHAEAADCAHHLAHRVRPELGEAVQRAQHEPQRTRQPDDQGAEDHCARVVPKSHPVGLTQVTGVHIAVAIPAPMEVPELRGVRDHEGRQALDDLLDPEEEAHQGNQDHGLLRRQHHVLRQAARRPAGVAEAGVLAREEQQEARHRHGVGNPGQEDVDDGLELQNRCLHHAQNGVLQTLHRFVDCIAHAEAATRDAARKQAKPHTLGKVQVHIVQYVGRGRQVQQMQKAHQVQTEGQGHQYQHCEAQPHHNVRAMPQEAQVDAGGGHADERARQDELHVLQKQPHHEDVPALDNVALHLASDCALEGLTHHPVVGLRWIVGGVDEHAVRLALEAVLHVRVVGAARDADCMRQVQLTFLVHAEV